MLLIVDTGEEKRVTEEYYFNMKKDEYKNYRTCPQCERTFPLSREYFKRLITQGKEAFHTLCKECEEENRRNKEWKEGKLLCHCCGEYKDINEFSPNGGTSPIRKGRRSMCRSCSTNRQKEHNKNLSDQEKLLKCLRWRWLSARDRSRRYEKIGFSLTIEDLITLWNKQNGKCALSGIPMTYELQKGRTYTNVSIDRINTNGDYAPNNIQLVCMACNQIKSDMLEEDMYRFCKMFFTLFGK